MKLKYKNKIITGIVLIMLSYASYLLPPAMLNIYNLSALLFLFIAGVVFVSEGVTLSLANKSISADIHRSKHNILVFIIISVVGAFFLDGVAKWSGKLWVYPYYPNNGLFFYFVTFIPGFAAYWLMIVESYFVTKIFFDYLHKGKQLVTRPFKYEDGLYKFLAIAGELIIFSAVIIIVGFYSGSNARFISAEDMKQITGNFQIPFVCSMLISLGLWFILEYIEHRRKRTSLLKDTLHGYFSPVLAVLAGSFACAILMETQNIPVGLWSYVNWPWESIKFFHLPFLVYLAWPIHYIVFLSLFRAFSKQESQEIWREDVIS